jgi:hypothetical protein
MISRIRSRHMNGSHFCMVLAASLALTACAANDAVGPSGSRAAKVSVAVNSPASLTSFGDTVTLSPRVLDAEGRPLDGARIRWSLSDAGIVQRDGDGIYRAIGNGKVTIVAELDPGGTGVRPAGYWAGRLADSVVVEVQQRPARLALAPVDTAFGTLGGSRQLNVQVTDARGNVIANGALPLIWQSADSSVVTVDSAGTVHSLGEGSARVTVRSDTLSGAAIFTVNARRPHTSCMVFTLRHQSLQECVTLEFVVRERARKAAGQ